MTHSNSPRISEGADPFYVLDLRQLLPREVVGVIESTCPSLSNSGMIVDVSEVTVDGVVVYEVAVHRASRTRDDRCVVACFKDGIEAEIGLPHLVAAWFQAYDPPPADSDLRGFTPCPN